MTRRPVLAVALVAVLLAAAVALTLAYRATARDRLAHDYEQLAGAEEALHATPGGHDAWRLSLNPAAHQRAAATCRAALKRLRADAKQARIHAATQGRCH